MQGTTVAGLELPISQLALGTMTFGDTASEEVAADRLAAALDPTTMTGRKPRHLVKAVGDTTLTSRDAAQAEGAPR